MGQSMIGGHRVAREGKIEAIEQLVEHPAAERRILQVGGHDDDLAFGADAQLQCVAEVRVGEKRVEHFQVVRHPAIVVAEIRDETALRALQGLMAMALAHARTLPKIEKSNAAISRRQLGNDDPSCIGNAGADNEQLEVLEGLQLHARHRMAQRLDVLVRRDQYRGGRHSGALRGGAISIALYRRNSVAKSGRSRSRGNTSGVAEGQFMASAGSSKRQPTSSSLPSHATVRPYR